MGSEIEKEIIISNFFHSSSVREYTQDFMNREMTSKSWVKKLWPKKSKDKAKELLKRLGVYTTRKLMKEYSNG